VSAFPLADNNRHRQSLNIFNRKKTPTIDVSISQAQTSTNKQEHG
jgi:hypothetical protein